MSPIPDTYLAVLAAMLLSAKRGISSTDGEIDTAIETALRIHHRAVAVVAKLNTP